LPDFTQGAVRFSQILQPFSAPFKLAQAVQRRVVSKNGTGNLFPRNSGFDRFLGHTWSRFFSPNATDGE